MNPVEITTGKSFKGLAAYLLHDAGRAATAERVGWALGEFLRTSKLNQRELARMKKNPQEEFTRKPDSWYETPEGQLASLRSLHSMMKAAVNGGGRK